MTQLKIEHCKLSYEGAFLKPLFALTDSPGKICDLLLEALEAFGSTSAGLTLEEGEPADWGVACSVDQFDTSVTVHGDRIEAHCPHLLLEHAAELGPIFESLWSGLAQLNAGAVAATHSFLFEAEAEIRGATYQDLLNRFAPAPQSLPAGTETAIVFYLPSEPARGYAESSLVLNRSEEIELGLQVNATLVFEASSIKVTEAISAATNRLVGLLRNLGIEWIEN